MDRDVLRAEPLFDNALQLRVSNGRHRREVTGQEREPEVFIFDVQRAPHAAWHLMDEAEGALIAAPVWRDRGKVRPQTVIRVLLDFEENPLAVFLFELD